MPKERSMPKHYQRIGADRVKDRRTIADAMEVLRTQAGFGDGDTARIWIYVWQLPSGVLVGSAAVFFESLDTEHAYVVSLPAAIRFNGVDLSGRQVHGDVFCLNEAIVDGANKVLTAESETFRAVEVEPVQLPEKPTNLDWRIVHCTLEHLGASDCYRNLQAGAPVHLRKFIPDRLYLDCERLTGLRIPPLKVLAGVLAQKDPTLKKLSHQKIADALAKFGIRRPVARARSRGRRNLALIQVGSKLLRPA
jgi:hypothetical protein